MARNSAAVSALCLCLLAVVAQAQTTTSADGRTVVNGVYQTPGIPASATRNLTASGLAAINVPVDGIANIRVTNITGGAGYGTTTADGAEPSASIAAAAAPLVAGVFANPVTAASVAAAALANPAAPIAPTPRATAAATSAPVSSSPTVYSANTTPITSVVSGGAGYGSSAADAAEPSAQLTAANAPKVSTVILVPVDSAALRANTTTPSTAASSVSGRRLLRT